MATSHQTRAVSSPPALLGFIFHTEDFSHVSGVPRISVQKVKGSPADQRSSEPVLCIGERLGFIRCALTLSLGFPGV